MLELLSSVAHIYSIMSDVDLMEDADLMDQQNNSGSEAPSSHIPNSKSTACPAGGSESGGSDDDDPHSINLHIQSSHDSLEDSVNPPKVCPICLDDIHPQCDDTTTPVGIGNRAACSHMNLFHQSCWTSWVQKNQNCPICRCSITSFNGASVPLNAEDSLATRDATPIRSSSHYHTGLFWASILINSYVCGIWVVAVTFTIWHSLVWHITMILNMSVVTILTLMTEYYLWYQVNNQSYFRRNPNFMMIIHGTMSTASLLIFTDGMFFCTQMVLYYTDVTSLVLPICGLCVCIAQSCIWIIGLCWLS